MFVITLAENMKGQIVSGMSVSVKLGGSSRELTEVMCMLFTLLRLGTDSRALPIHSPPTSQLRHSRDTGRTGSQGK